MRFKYILILGAFAGALLLTDDLAKKAVAGVQRVVTESSVSVGPARSYRGVAREAEFTWTGKIEEGGTLEIKGINGGIEAFSSTGSDVEVYALKKARRSDVSEVSIDVVRHGQGITICAVYPGRDNFCAPGDEGRMSTRNNDVSVRFEVRVPEGVSFIGRTVNGKVEAMNMPADVQAYTVNGSVELTAAGQAKARTVNGSIKASVGAPSWEGALDFQTVNGSVRVVLPEGVNAEVAGSTLHGRIQTDFPLTMSGFSGSKKISGVLGSGGGELKLQSTNGSIQVLRGG